MEISGVGGVATTTGTRQAGAKVAVRNGETIILGGFISDSRSTSISGIPGLMNIPGLGNLFRSSSVENLRAKKLIMLMRPRPSCPRPNLRRGTGNGTSFPASSRPELEIRTGGDRRKLKIERTWAKEAARGERSHAESGQKATQARLTPAPTPFPSAPFPPRRP